MMGIPKPKWLRKLRHKSDNTSTSTPDTSSDDDDAATWTQTTQWQIQTDSDLDLAKLDIIYGWESKYLSEEPQKQIPNPRFYCGEGVQQRILLIVVPSKGAGNAWTPQQLLMREQHLSYDPTTQKEIYPRFTCENYYVTMFTYPGEESYQGTITGVCNGTADFSCLAFTYDPGTKGSYEEMVSNFMTIKNKFEGGKFPVPVFVLGINGAGGKVGEVEREEVEQFIDMNAACSRFFECCGKSGKGLMRGFYAGVIRESHRYRMKFDDFKGNMRGEEVKASHSKVAEMLGKVFS